MKRKKQKFFIISLVLIIFAMYGFLPPLPKANAMLSIFDAQDLISDSDVGQVVTHAITFTTATTTVTGDYWRIDFDSSFSGISDVNATCGYGELVASSTGDTLDCTLAAADIVATSTGVTITNVTNASAGNEGTKYITINHYSSVGELKERVKIAVVIVKTVLMTATVDSSLTFNVSGTSSGAVVNGVVCDNTSTATATPFGTLETNIASTVCQVLDVTTNANDGYIVTVEQNHELLSDAGANINSFNNSPNSTGSTTPGAWNNPDNTLDLYHTYGHMGLTSNDDDTDDDSIMPNDYYQAATAYFAGLNSTDPMIVMAHDGPVDGVTQNYGVASILYRAEIGSLQEAGDYESLLTYICTPTF